MPVRSGQDFVHNRDRHISHARRSKVNESSLRRAVHSDGIAVIRQGETISHQFARAKTC